MNQQPYHTTQTSNGVGFFGLLTIAFIVLKLTNVISWSWWLVLLPIWAPIVLIAALLVFALLVATLSGGELRAKKTRKHRV